MNSARPFVDADFPGYAEAVARENVIRGAACLGINEKICGLEVRPLTAWHLRWLTLVRCPFLLDGISAEEMAAKPDIVDDIMRMLWIISPMFTPHQNQIRAHWWQRKTPRDKFNESFAPILKEPVDKVCRALLEYIDESYVDAGESKHGDDKSYFAFEVNVAHELHEHYGYRIDFWNPMARELNPTHIPLKLVFQFRKVRQKWDNPKSIITNHSEKFISLGLERMNADMKKEKANDI